MRVSLRVAAITTTSLVTTTDLGTGGHGSTADAVTFAIDAVAITTEAAESLGALVDAVPAAAGPAAAGPAAAGPAVAAGRPSSE